MVERTRRRTRSSKKKAKKKTKRKGYQYKRRSRDQVKARANQQGGDFDKPFKSEYTLFKPHDGVNKIRILPPPEDVDWANYGIDIYVNYSIGSDNQTYLSRSKMLQDRDDPIARELSIAKREGDDDLVKALKPKKRVLVWLIDRRNEDSGPMLWAMPWTVDKDIAALLEDEDTREYLDIDNPDEGYDVTFRKDGAGLKTKYGSYKIARKSTPLMDDEEEQAELLTFINENQLPDTLVFFENERIASQLDGSAGADDDDEDEEEEKPRTRKSRRKTKRQRLDDDEEEEKEDDDIDDDADELDDDDDPEDDDWDDDDEDDEDPEGGEDEDPEDDEVDDDDIDDDDDDEEEEEEDEPPRRRTKKKTKTRRRRR